MVATYYVRTDGNDGNAGTSDTAGGAWLTLGKALTTAVAGDTVNVRASAGNAASYPTSSLDYTTGGAHIDVTADGSAASGFVRVIGYNGMPTIGSPGLGFFGCSRIHFKNLYFVATGNTNGIYGIVHAAISIIEGCIFNMNSQSGMRGVKIAGGVFIGNEIYGGSTSPSANSGCEGIHLDRSFLDGTSYGILIQGNRIRYCQSHGIYDTNWAVSHICDNLIYGCAGDGLVTDTIDAGLPFGHIVGNTIHGNSGHGINLTGSNGAMVVCIRNNNITGHTGSGKAGINCATSNSDIRSMAWGYNNVWNNTTNYNNCTADPTNLSVDPDYVDAPNGDFTVQEATILGAAFPTAF